MFELATFFYQYSNMDLRLLGQTSICAVVFFLSKSLLGIKVPMIWNFHLLRYSKILRSMIHWFLIFEFGLRTSQKEKERTFKNLQSLTWTPRSNVRITSIYRTWPVSRERVSLCCYRDQSNTSHQTLAWNCPGPRQQGVRSS